MAARHELFFLAAAAPFLIFPNRFTGVAALLLVVLWLARWLTLGYLTRSTKLDIPIALILLMTAVGMLVSVDLSVSWPHFWGIVLGVAIYYGLVNGLHNEQDIQRMGVALLGFGTAAALLSMPFTDWKGYQYYDLTWVSSHIPTLDALAQALPTGGLPGSESGLFHPRPIGGTMGLLLPAALSLLFFGHGRVIRSLAALAALVMGFTLVLAQALSALAGTVIAVVLLALWRFRWLLWVLLPVAILGAVLSYQFVLSASYPGDPNTKNTVGAGIVGRFAIWLWAIEALRHQPLTGVGLFSFDYTLSGSFPMALFPGVHHAHNFFLQVALDLGVPGLLAVLWLLLALWHSIKAGLRQANEANTRILLVGVGAGVVSYMIFGLADSPTLGTKPGAAFWAMLGLVGALNSLYSRRPSAHSGVPYGKIGAVTVLLACVVLAMLFIPGLRGIAYLNLGTLQAHKALAQARDTGHAPEELMQSARSNLEKALADGQDTVHTYDLLGSINGWTGDCSQSVYYVRKSVMAGGAQAFGSRFLVQDLLPIVGGNNAAIHPLARDGLTALLERLSLPRTEDMQRNRYRLMIEAGATPWGPISSWWEPYLTLAIILNEQARSPEAAAQILQIGMEQANYKAPLSCYHVEQT